MKSKKQKGKTMFVKGDKLVIKLSKDEEKKIEQKLKEIEGLIPFKGSAAEFIRKMREGKQPRLRYP